MSLQHGLDALRVDFVRAAPPGRAALYDAKIKELQRTMMAEALGCYAEYVEQPEDIRSALQRVWRKVEDSGWRFEIAPRSSAEHGEEARFAPTLRWRGLDSNFQYAGAVNLDRTGAGGLIRGTAEITERNRWTQGDLRMASGTAVLK
jgi:hypothetical protein